MPRTSSTRTTSDARRGGGVVRVQHDCARRVAQRDRDDRAGAARSGREVRDPEARDRLRVLGQPRLPPGRPVRVRRRSRRGRRVAAGAGEPRRDGRGVGAVRGVGRDPDRRGRQRARSTASASRRRAICTRSWRCSSTPTTTCRCGPRWSTWPRSRRARSSTRTTRPSTSSPRSRPARSATRQENPNALRKGDVSAADVLKQPVTHHPLRDADIFPITDGSAAIVIAAGDLARKASKRPAWIRGIEHRIEAHGLGVRDLTRSESTASRRRRGRGVERQGRRRRAARAVQSRRADPRRGARARREHDERSTRRAARSPRTR